MKINPYIATFAMIVILIMAVALFKGCDNNKDLTSKFKKVDSLNTALLSVVEGGKIERDSIKKAYQDSLDFERGQNDLLRAQKERTERDMDHLEVENVALIKKYKDANYKDTSAVLVPRELMNDCESCFTNLEKSNLLSNRYRNDMNLLQENWDKQNQLYQKRFKVLEEERLGFQNKISYLVSEQKEAINKLKPRGRLYLSWGILWQPWPKYAGGGLLYQTKENMIYGAKWYYGVSGHMVETTVNFPL